MQNLPSPTEPGFSTNLLSSLGGSQGSSGCKTVEIEKEKELCLSSVKWRINTTQKSGLIRNRFHGLEMGMRIIPESFLFAPLILFGCSNCFSCLFIIPHFVHPSGWKRRATYTFRKSANVGNFRFSNTEETKLITILEMPAQSGISDPNFRLTCEREVRFRNSC